MWKKFLKNKDDDIKIDTQKLPLHIAIIMDGNGRWAKKRGLPRTAGHKKGVSVLRNIVKYASSIKIKYLTVYAFSTENWKRPLKEVEFLMELFSFYLDKEVEDMNKNNVRLRFIGDISKLSLKLQEKIQKAQEKTKDNTGLNLNIAINYGGRDEILKAVQCFANLSQEEREKINEDNFNELLYTKNQPQVDLLLRTGGDMRISNFLLWQSAYAELFFSDKNWPEFTKEDFLEIILSFTKRERRFGGLDSKG